MSADRSSSDGRPVTLFTGQWADLPLAELAAEASEWGFDGLELACWGDHFEIERGYEDFAQRWGPIIDVFDAEGVRFALEVHPTEIAYDFVTTRRALEALDWREGFGINLDPSHFIPQFLDPAKFALEFAARIYHVHIKDSGMDREYGARDALGFVRRSDFAPSSLAFDASFQSEPSA